MIADSILPSLLASAGSSDAESWRILCVILVLLGAGHLCLQIFEKLKGKKPHAQDLQHFATQKDHAALSQRVDKVEAEHNFQTHATQRALGRIEGKLGRIEKSNSN